MTNSAEINPEKKLESELYVGPMSILQQAVMNHTQVLINLRNNEKILGRVKSFDRHMNMVLESVRVMWVEDVRKGKGVVKKSLTHDHYIQKMFLRGDSVILVVRNPNSAHTDD